MMLTRVAAFRPLEPARLAIRRSLLHRHIQAVVAGKSAILDLDLAERGVDPAALLIGVMRSLTRDGDAYVRLRRVIVKSGFDRRVIDGLGSRDVVVRSRSARLAGELQLEAAVPWIAPLLLAREPAVRSAAARAMGVIGGVRSSDALVMAVQRLGPRPVLIIALARAAPDLYLETILSTQRPRAAQPAVALAAGLRRRQAAVTPLALHIGSGSSRMRAARTRALGWIGSESGLPALTSALEQPDWRVRTAALKAIGAIRPDQVGAVLGGYLVDRNAKVRSAARNVVSHLGRRPEQPAGVA